MKTKDRKKMVLIPFDRALIKPMMVQSKNIPGCRRPDVGSISHFVNHWIKIGLKSCGLPVDKMIEYESK